MIHENSSKLQQNVKNTVQWHNDIFQNTQILNNSAVGTLNLAFT